jgi:alkaline phosphatase D
MVGYTEMRQSAIWLQTVETTEVYLIYYDSTSAQNRIKSEVITTREQTFFTARFILFPLEPGRTYFYEVWADDKKLSLSYPLRFKAQQLWQFRTDPPPLRIAFGSCLYVNDSAYDRPGKPYGGDYHILKSINQKQPDLMIWLGDNTYYRDADFGGLESMAYRNTHTRAIPELQPLLATGSHIAIWDDHDYGPNDSYGTWIGKGDALKLFDLFWANPSTRLPDIDGNIGYHRFGDVAIYLLDNRWYRTPIRDTAPTILGKEQITWLLRSLAESKATFNIVAMGGQFLNEIQVYENYANYPDERLAILEALGRLNNKNIIFLSGDRHHSQVSQLKLPGGKTIHDFTCSPLTSRAHENVKEDNPLMIEGSMIKERNFAIMEISGPRLNRRLELTYYNSAGKELYRYALGE